MKIRQVGTGLFYADGQTDRTKLPVASRNVENVPKISFGTFRDMTPCG